MKEKRYKTVHLTELPCFQSSQVDWIATALESMGINCTFNDDNGQMIQLEQTSQRYL